MVIIKICSTLGLIISSILIGFFGHWYYMCTKSVGVIRIDKSDPDDAPYMFLEVKNRMELEKLQNKQFAVFEILNENYISTQK